MWNSGQQPGTWWPNYNYQYQATPADGDRSQEWAARAAMWAQQRLMHQQFQQQNQMQAAPNNNPPFPDGLQHPPLPEAPPQPASDPVAEIDYTRPPLPDSSVAKPLSPADNHGFIHEERKTILKGLSIETEAHSPWSGGHDEPNNGHHTALQGTFRDSNEPHQDSYASDRGQWKPFGETEFRNSPKGGDTNDQHPDNDYSRRDAHIQANDHIDKRHHNDHHEFHSDENHDNNKQYQEYYHNNQPHEEQWSQNQYWNQNQPQFPPGQLQFPVPPDANFHPPAMEYAHPGHQIPMMPNFFQHGMMPESGRLSIPEQIVVSQIPDISVAELNKRKGLPQWLREGLNKMEKEKQKKVDKDRVKEKSLEDTEAEDISITSHAKKTDEIASTEVQHIKKEQTDRTSDLLSPTKGGYSSDDEEEDGHSEEPEEEKTPEEKAREDMMKIKLWMTETLLSVTTEEIVSVVNEVYNQARKKAPVSAKQLRESGGLQALRSGLGMDYDSSSGNESDDKSDGPNNSSKWLEESRNEPTPVHDKKDEDHKGLEKNEDGASMGHRSRGLDRDTDRPKRKMERRTRKGENSQRAIASDGQSDSEERDIQRQKVNRKIQSASSLVQASDSSSDEKSREGPSRSSSSESSEDRSQSEERHKSTNRKKRKRRDESDSSSDEFKSKRSKRERSVDKEKGRKPKSSDKRDASNDKRQRRKDKTKLRDRNRKRSRSREKDIEKKRKKSRGKESDGNVRDKRRKERSRESDESLSDKKCKDKEKGRERNKRRRKKNESYKEPDDRDKKLKKQRNYSSDSEESSDLNDNRKQRSHHKDGKKHRKHRSKSSSRSPKRRKR